MRDQSVTHLAESLEELTQKMTRGLELLAKGSFLLGLLASPVLAQELEEPNGYPITDVNLRAGPGTEYPVLVTVPTDAPITILGCLEDHTWCDTIFEEQRGWMSSIYLAGYYDGEYYLLSDYAPDLGYQVVTFDRAAYWDAYYQDEPFYDDRSRVTEARGEDWVDDGVFYDRLSPHGSWTWTQGQYVWVPTGVDSGWRPYTRGRWVYTDYGWTWASYEPFGWATYHYGRWGFSHRIGWFWVPGNRWGPAWVSWRQSDDYLAWAPLPPAYDRGGLSINVSFGDIPSYYWSGVPSRYFLSDDLPRYYVRDRARWRNVYDSTRPIGHTTVINNSVVNNVVNVNYVEQHTNQTVVERNVRRTRDWDRAGKIHGDDYEVYRPGLREGRDHHGPEKIRDIDEVAKLSKTREFARGERATDDLLAPPEVREAIKKRKGGRVIGEDTGPREVSRGEPDRPKFDRRLPKGRDAEGPPPARKKARAEPLPAHDLGRSRGGPKGKPDRQRGPVPDGGERAISAPDSGKGPPSARGPKAEGPKGAPTEAEKNRRRAEPQGPGPRSRPEDEVRNKPSREGAQSGPKGPPRQRKAVPGGKPNGQGSPGQGQTDRKPAMKKGPPEKAKSDDEKGPPQARSQQGPSGPQGPSDRKPAMKKGPPEKAKSDDKKGPPQARSQQGPSGPQGPSDRKPAPRKGSPEKGKANDQKGPPQARSDGQGPSGPQGPADRKPAPKKGSPEKGKSNDQKGPPQARSREPGPSAHQSSSDRKAAANKKPPPKREARPKKDNAPSQAQQGRPRGLEQKASSNRKPEVKKAPPKREAEPKKQKAPSQAQQGRPRGLEQKASLNRKPAARKAPPKGEANSRKSQAPREAQQGKPRGSEKKASSNRKPEVKNVPPKREANLRKSQAPREVQQRKEAAAGSKVSAGERNKKKQKKKN